MNTTETTGALDLDSAAELIVQPENDEAETEQNENIEEAEIIEETDEDTIEEETDDEDSELDEQDEQDDDTEEQEVEQEQTFTVKVDGQEKSVTLDELKQGYSGQAFVQKGMQENAEQRKQVEAVYEDLKQVREQTLQLLHQAQSGNIPTQPTPPTLELSQADPIGYIEAKAQYDADMANWNNHVQQFQYLQQQQQQANANAIEEYQRQEITRLIELVPEFGDSKTAESLKNTISKAGEAYGYTHDEIKNVMDHRAILVLRDAAKYQEIQANKKLADEKAKPARKRKQPIKPGAKKISSNAKQLRAQQNKLKQTGSIDDALALMFQN